ncbi:sucrose nonfermenting 4-like protein [Camellia sinensis]|uniref:sucrose nonfermenting 4-like protein n=1 Tax=Camellia sinensis TaxID=4442 RepID=UPI001035C005|nr:sucrose nonfermenting 4-like protein [Camellia sinensis]
MAMSSATGCPADETNLTGVGEIRLIPDLSTKCIIPWAKQEGMVLGDMHLKPGEAWEYCPREALRRVSKILKDEFNLVMYAGFESEFYLLKSALREGKEEWFSFDTTPYCSASAFDAASPVLHEVVAALQSLNIAVEQYKFFVDGEWRHDEHQPFVSGNYGVVNIVFLAREPDVIPAIYTPETPGRSSMDVDNDPFFHLEAVPRISEADIDISRQRISVFLSTHTAYELLPESGKVIALDVNLPVKQAFHILYEQGIPVAPLWDFCKGQFVGVLSALDFILILREVFL